MLVLILLIAKKIAFNNFCRSITTLYGYSMSGKSTVKWRDTMCYGQTSNLVAG